MIRISWLTTFLVLIVILPMAPLARASSASATITAVQGWQKVSGVQVQQGHRYTITQSGSWTVDHRNFGYVDGGGYSHDVDAGIYQGCKLDTSWVYGLLIARVGGGSEFPVGRGLTFDAKQHGTLELRIHDGDNCLGDNGGSLQVKVVEATPPKPEPVPTPEQGKPVSFEVHASKRWQPSKLTVKKGVRYGVWQVSGSWTIDSKKLPKVNANGYAGEATGSYNGCKNRTSVRYGVLLARIGQGASFAIGTEKIFKAEADGTLEFRINDADGCLKNNAGSVKLTLQPSVTGLSDIVKGIEQVWDIVEAVNIICRGVNCQHRLRMAAVSGTIKRIGKVTLAVDITLLSVESTRLALELKAVNEACGDLSKQKPDDECVDAKRKALDALTAVAETAGGIFGEVVFELLVNALKAMVIAALAST